MNYSTRTSIARSHQTGQKVPGIQFAHHLSSIVALLLCLQISIHAHGQQGNHKVYTSDIDNFWTAFDSIGTTKDSLKQVQFIQTLYIDKGTKGIKAFMLAREYSGPLWVKLINRYPKFWNSIRPNTLLAKSKSTEIEQSIRTLKELYPGLKEASMYFTIGGLRSGGTTMGNMVLIGAEIATGDGSTDVSEFPDNWLAGVFKSQGTDNIVPLNIHEYIHTQQRGRAQNLLGQAIREGACDFITELVMGRPLTNNYLQYGMNHEQELKTRFMEEMFTNHYGNWLYNGSDAETVADLGYFMGYTICKSYYQHAADKKSAIKEIIELNYSDSGQVEIFLEKARYYSEKIDKAALINAFEKKRPHILKIEPFGNGDSLVDADIKKLTFVFSAPMNKNGYSINAGSRGKAFYPITSVIGFSEDRTAFTVKLEMKPGHDYEFVVTDKSFKSADGYPARPYTVKFRTR